MKKKIFISLAALFFAAFTFYNVQVSSNEGDITLEHIALMAEASSESGGGSKNCMKTGGTQAAWALACQYVENSLPSNRCGSRMMIYNGSGYTQCF